ncbi:MAG: ribosome maturation factor RimP [Eubacteriales bacterium]
MSQNQKSVVQTVKQFALPLAQELGYTLWDVEFVKEGAQRILRFTIDSENGITIDDCEKFHRAIDPMLDEADPIQESYSLEVSSPGIERELHTDEHIKACEGEQVELRLYAPVNGARVYRGTLLPLLPDGRIAIDVSGKTMEFERAAVSKLKTVFEF